MGLGFRIEGVAKADYEKWPHWSYGGFHQYREFLAREIGLTLSAMEGFAAKGLSWDEVDDPLKDLLHHSDCDGELDPTQCQSIAERLEKLSAAWPDDGSVAGYHKSMTEPLIWAMKLAAKHKKPLIFC